MDNIDKKVINIDYPCIQDIILRKDESDICFTLSDGQDETKLFFKNGQIVDKTVGALPKNVLVDKINANL